MSAAEEAAGEQPSMNSEGSDSGQEFMVEKILAMRRRHGKRQFKIRWKGYGPEEDTWEPEENCDCTELIEEFLKESAAKKRNQRSGRRPKQQQLQPQSPSATESVASEAAPSVGALFNEEPLPSGPEGFERGLEPEKVVGAAKLDGKLHLLVRWRDTDNSQSSEAELVPASEANIRCPELVIAFYESSLAWCPDDDEDAII
ncbi:hypothetical protein BOX15_Mlig017863g3 [Macrostomum lignano]|uniref:Chromo domain-containing protein n=1 Tax=Macrostomum lignano TaxID=282301 RepID=A0A267EWY2_9PLAT|nr:hypothetical protein BOX15_Mlig017863g3 [Macrostomum lignano]